MSEIRQAASLVLVRDSVAGLEVLMVTRSQAMVFAGGAMVFPGGAVDSADHAWAAQRDHPEECAHRHAAIREAHEEVGVTVAVEHLVPLSRWLPPLHIPRRFDTRFYLAALEGDPPLAPDGTEVVAVQWIRPQAALEASGVRLLFPTLMHLHRLATYTTAQQALAHTRAHPPRPITPHVAERDGIDHLCIPDDLGFPVTSLPLANADRG